MGRLIRRLGPAALILSTLVACDNVKWGGMDLELQPPPPAEPAPVDSSAIPPEELPPPLPEGPVLGVVEIDGNRGRLLTIAEVTGQSLVPLAAEDTLPGFRARLGAEVLPPGTEYEVYQRGAAVGRFVIDGPMEVADGYCGETLAFPGYIQLSPSVAGSARLLALPMGTIANPDRAAPAIESSTRGQRINLMRLYGEQIGANQARWPSNVDAARRDLQVIDLGRGSSSAIAGTFLFRDQLSVGEPGNSAYSMFILAENPANAYEAGYVWYRPASTSGKGAPRFLDILDWDADGSVEMVLDVLGADSRWFATLNQSTPGAWDLEYQERCGQPAPQAATQP